MPSLRLLNLWLHLCAASVWIGAAVSLAFLWLPQVRAKIDPASWEELLLGLGRRYVRWAWVAIELLVLTGIFNLMSVGIDTGFTFPPAFLRRLIAKLFVVLLMIGIQIGLSLAWVPRLANALSAGRAERAVRRALVATSLGGGVVVWLAMSLRR